MKPELLPCAEIWERLGDKYLRVQENFSIVLAIFQCTYNNKRTSLLLHTINSTFPRSKAALLSSPNRQNLLCSSISARVLVIWGSLTTYPFLPLLQSRGENDFDLLCPFWYPATCLMTSRHLVNTEPWQEALECIRNLFIKTSPQPQSLTEEQLLRVVPGPLFHVWRNWGLG